MTASVASPGGSPVGLITGLHKIVYDIDHTMPFQIRGVPLPLNKEEFIVYNGLAIFPRVSRKNAINESVFIEIICYSKHAEYRTDRDFYRPWKIAKPYFDTFSQARFVVENACIQFNEGKMVYLDLRSLGDYATGINQQSPELKLHCISLSFEGFISQGRN